ncbi:MAG: hypothetical protein ABGZ17_30515, partial [Planctomycetaceae bacterium]
MKQLRTTLKRCGPGMLLCVCLGCGSGEGPSTDASGDPSATASGSGSDSATADSGAAAQKKEFRPVNLGSFGTASAGTASGQKLSAEQTMRTVLNELKPLQIVLGTWRGTTRKKHGGFQTVDQTEWVFDLKTDRGHPALSMASDKSPYLRSARLTYVPEDGKYQLQIVDAEGVQRLLDGEFLVAVQDV